MAKVVFFRLLSLLGYGSAKQYAGRRAFAMYSKLCVPRADEESAFWKGGECLLRFILSFSCHLCGSLPPPSSHVYSRCVISPHFYAPRFLHCVIIVSLRRLKYTILSATYVMPRSLAHTYPQNATFHRRSSRGSRSRTSMSGCSPFGCAPSPRPTVVTFDGPAGSGKSSLARLVADRLDAPVVHLDDLLPGWDGLPAAPAAPPP